MPSANRMKGQHYPFRIFVNGKKTRSKFMYLHRAHLKCLEKILETSRYRQAQVVRVKDNAVLFHAGRTVAGVVGRRIKP